MIKPVRKTRQSQELQASTTPVKHLTFSNPRGYYTETNPMENHFIKCIESAPKSTNNVLILKFNRRNSEYLTEDFKAKKYKKRQSRCELLKFLEDLKMTPKYDYIKLFRKYNRQQFPAMIVPFLLLIPVICIDLWQNNSIVGNIASISSCWLASVVFSAQLTLCVWSAFKKSQKFRAAEMNEVIEESNKVLTQKGLRQNLGTLAAWIELIDQDLEKTAYFENGNGVQYLNKPIQTFDKVMCGNGNDSDSKNQIGFGKSNPLDMSGQALLMNNTLNQSDSDDDNDIPFEGSISNEIHFSEGLIPMKIESSETLTPKEIKDEWKVPDKKLNSSQIERKQPDKKLSSSQIERKQPDKFVFDRSIPARFDQVKGEGMCNSNQHVIEEESTSRISKQDTSKCGDSYTNICFSSQGDFLIEKAHGPIVEKTPEPIEKTPEPIEKTPEPIEKTPEPIEKIPEPIEKTPEPIEKTPELEGGNSLHDSSNKNITDIHEKKKSSDGDIIDPENIQIADTNGISQKEMISNQFDSPSNGFFDRSLVIPTARVSVADEEDIHGSSEKIPPADGNQEKNSNPSNSSSNLNITKGSQKSKKMQKPPGNYLDNPTPKVPELEIANTLHDTNKDAVDIHEKRPHFEGGIVDPENNQIPEMNGISQKKMISNQFESNSNGFFDRSLIIQRARVCNGDEEDNNSTSGRIPLADGNQDKNSNQSNSSSYLNITKGEQKLKKMQKPPGNFIENTYKNQTTKKQNHQVIILTIEKKQSWFQ